MSDVSCRPCAVFVDALETDGIPLSEAVRGLSIPPETLLRPSNRLTWEEWLTVLENCSRVLGGPEALEAAGLRYYERAGGLLGVLAAQVSSARPVYHMATRWYGPTLFAPTRATSEDLPDGRIRTTIEIRPGFRVSELFFQTMLGGIRAVPLLLGQPPADVEMVIEDRRATYVITPPASLTVIGKVRRALKWRTIEEKATFELSVQRDEIERGFELARQTEERLFAQTELLQEEQRQRERIEELLLQAQKLETLGRLASGIAHDFNLVLTSIIGHVDSALGALNADDPLRVDLEEVRGMSERGAGLVEQLVGVSRPQPVLKRRVLLNEVVMPLVPVLRRLLPSSVRVHALPAARALEVVADPGQLEQILLNLGANARDAMPNGGNLEIEMRQATPEEAPGGGEFARLEVRDDGMGMDASTLASAFEPFFTTKGPGKGTGLGLASVHNIVTSAGGTVWLESEPGEGTSVILQLPIAG
ncbi:MAG: ATP-binding protein [Myxococcota bacterium]|nr:ATP-binding protein [Myxococcota bacterium]